MSRSIVLLHGFALTHRMWDATLALLDAERYRPQAFDLPGHARTPVAGYAELVESLAARIPPGSTLCGYSMGARAALAVALGRPELVERLVLVSGSAGIADPAERRARLAADERLAAQIEADGIAALDDAWSASPLFADDPPAVRGLVAAEQRRSDPRGLAGALRALGQGAFEPAWERLGELAMPVAVLAGERDGRYVELGRRLVSEMRDASLEIVPGAGHRVPLEAPEAVAAAIVME